MAVPVALLLLLILFCVILIAALFMRPGATMTRGGKILAFLVLFCLPILCMSMGVSNQLERSTSTEFCLSCHTMEAFGKSLHVDDPSYLAAAHFQNHRVPAGSACYTCHTDYTMFGTFKSKLRGLRHVYIYYLTTPPTPEKIKLYEAYNNRECLHCHEGARSFETGVVHNSDPDLLPAIKANKKSCISSGCHEVVHNVATLNNVKFWNGGH
jgi:cytochrome c-type protein NapC